MLSMYVQAIAYILHQRQLMLTSFAAQQVVLPDIYGIFSMGVARRQDCHHILRAH